MTQFTKVWNFYMAQLWNYHLAATTGNYTLTQIQSKMFSFGLVGARSGKKMPLSSVEHILKNPFYYGHFLYRNEIHQGSHKPMISKKLFDRIQEALILNGKPRKKRGPKNFQFLNFAVCGECGYSITAERHIKKSGLKFVYYRCTHKSKTQNCSQTRFLREEVLTEQVKKLSKSFFAWRLAGKISCKSKRMGKRKPPIVRPFRSKSQSRVKKSKNKNKSPDGRLPWRRFGIAGISVEEK